MNIIIRKHVLITLLDIAAKKDVQYYLKALYADPAGFLVASNGSMLATLTIDPFESPSVGPNAGVLIPRDELGIAAKVCGKGGYIAIRPEGIHVLEDEGQTVGSTVIPYSPVNERFLSWRSLFPTHKDLEGEEHSFNGLQFQAKLLVKAATFIEAVTDNKYPLIYGLPKKVGVVHAPGDDRAAVIIMPLSEKALMKGVLPVIELIARSSIPK